LLLTGLRVWSRGFPLPWKVGAGKENDGQGGSRRRAGKDVGWDTRERIARRYGLVKRFAGKRGNEELDGGEGGFNGAA
jgi:hypothetical protein